jgi:iron complex outermembrane recepter protein
MMSLRPIRAAIGAAFPVVATLVAVAAIPSLALAQQSGLPQVVISASRFEENRNQVPAHVRVITREEIEQSGALTIVDVLFQLAAMPVRGFSLGQLGLGATVDLGGHGVTASSNTLVLLDGQRLNPFDSSVVAWESVPLGAIERIEVLYGGAGVQFGNGAVGGVVNLITRAGAQRPNRAHITFGNHGTVIVGTDVSVSEGANSLSVSASRARTDGWRENSAAESTAVRAGLTRELGRGDRVFLDAFTSESMNQQPGGVLGRVGEGEARAAKFNNVGSFASGSNDGIRLGATMRLARTLTFEGEATYSTRDLGYTAPYYDRQWLDSYPDWMTGDPVYYLTGPVRTVADSRELLLTPRIRGRLAGIGTFVAGLDVSSARQDSRNEFTQDAQSFILANQGTTYHGGVVADSQVVRLHSRSAYLIARMPMAAGVEASGGVRHQIQDVRTRDVSKDRIDSELAASQRYSATAGDIALNWKQREGLRTWVKWNQSFRFANIDEFWGFDMNTFGRNFVGALRPQNARAVELGGEWLISRTMLSASVFRSVTRDEIRYDPNRFINANIEDEIRRQGLIFDATTTLQGGITVAAGGRIQRSVYDAGSYAGTTIALAPDRTFNARLTYPIAANWTLGGVVTHVGSQPYDASPDQAAGLDSMPAYTVTDVFAAYRHGGWEWRLAVRNLTNERYATYGGHGFVTLEDGGGASRYYHYPSDPRTVALTARYTF